MLELLHDFETTLLSLDRVAARRLIAEARRNLTSMEIVDQLIVTALTDIGESWQQGDAALSQIYMSGRICEDIVDELLPPGDPNRKDQPPMAIAVLNDYHMLGKRIVYASLRAAGYNLLDYGRVTSEEAVQRAIEDNISVLLISTLMLNSALQVKDVTDALKAHSGGIRVIVGGAPFLFDHGLWREVNADAMGQSAAEAVSLVHSVLGGM